MNLIFIIEDISLPNKKKNYIDAYSYVSLNVSDSWNVIVILLYVKLLQCCQCFVITTNLFCFFN